MKAEAAEIGRIESPVELRPRAGDSPRAGPAPAITPQASPTEPASGIAWARARLYTALAAGAMLLVGVVVARTGFPVAGAALVWSSLALGMFFGLRAAAEALGEKRVDIDVLMVVGAGLAAGIGHPAEGALLLFLFVLSGALEDLAMARTRREIEALHRLMPTEAFAWRGGAWVECAPETLAPGDRIKIRPGDLIPVDARIDEGRSSIDQSAVTGESMPRAVLPGDAVFAGTVNLENALEAEVLKPAAQSSLQRILDLVTEAREQREPMQRLIDRFGQPYAIGVLATSVAVLLLWWWQFGQPLSSAAYTAITFLIVLSPCALIIATPTATLTAIGRGARAGVLFKGGQSIERLSRVGAVCFDKTGTLTMGRPRLIEVHPVGWSDSARLLGLAAGLEADSTHPIAASVREGARSRGIEPVPVERVTHRAGLGIRAVLDGDPVGVGSFEFVEELIPVCLRSRTHEVVGRIQGRGQLAAVVAAGGSHGAAAVLIISDPVRPGADTIVEDLHGAGVDSVCLLTGDNARAAAHVADRLGIDRWHADLLPEDKVRILREIKDGRRTGRASTRLPGVAFIGDGVNDAPAMAAADVSLAVGSIGSDAALESADIVLLNDDLACVPWALRLTRRARAILRFNIIAAMSIIIVMGLATLIGSRIGQEVPMSLGVVAHEGGTLLVVANALRLLLALGVR